MDLHGEESLCVYDDQVAVESYALSHGREVSTPPGTGDRTFGALEFGELVVTADSGELGALLATAAATGDSLGLATLTVVLNDPDGDLVAFQIELDDVVVGSHDDDRVAAGPPTVTFSLGFSRVRWKVFSCARTCRDIDECADAAKGGAPCGPNAACTNLIGDFTCECLVGYEGDPFAGCTDTDECADEADDCDDNATCDNTDGSFTCTCLTGFAGDGASCEAICGDGLVVGEEACDDLNDRGGDGCLGCTVEVGWVCDEDPGPASVCVPGSCGDEVVAVGAEDCEDGNGDSGDGCSENCLFEPGFDCLVDDVTGLVDCTSICGDGLVVGSEACDDGNDDRGDGCTDRAVEEGWVCNGAPSVCSLDCGDGVLDDGEISDDGNDDAGDGCADCAVEDGFVCDDSEPTVCVPDADGDGVGENVKQLSRHREPEPGRHRRGRRWRRAEQRSGGRDR